MTDPAASSPPDAADVIVAGTGPIGLAAALAFTDAGFRTALIGPAPAREDRRTTAVMVPGLRFLDALGLGESLRAAGAPLRAMRILDGTSRLIRSSPVLFRAGEIGEDAFGWNIPNSHLLGVLDEALSQRPALLRFEDLVADWTPSEDFVTARLRSGVTVRARLVVAADGRDSPARAAAGITMRAKTLPQSALVLSFRHSRSHDFTSNEFHTEHGPFTQVPLPGNRSSLVWVAAPREAERLASLPDEALSRAIEERMQSMLGVVEAEPGRQVFPLVSVAPAAYGRSRVALAGEAAHTIPPIGAQGFNLGLADVRDLLAAAESSRADPGAPAVIDRYGRARAFAVGSRSAAVNALNASLLTDFLPVQAVRGAGLALLRRAAPLRGLFMREGLEPGGALRRSRAGTP